MADGIERATTERPSVVAGHVRYGESGVSVSELNSVPSLKLRAGVHPEERERGSGGDGAREDCRAAQLHQLGSVGSECHI